MDEFQRIMEELRAEIDEEMAKQKRQNPKQNVKQNTKQVKKEPVRPRTYYSSDDEVAIVKVLFNDPATIVFWNDGTKTIVKCGTGDFFDEEKGLAMAIAKKAFGNNGSYYEIFKRICTGQSEIDKFNIPEREIEDDISPFNKQTD